MREVYKVYKMKVSGCVGTCVFVLVCVCECVREREREPNKGVCDCVCNYLQIRLYEQRRASVLVERGGKGERELKKSVC